MCVCFFFFKQKTAYEMRISDWSSDVCSSDLLVKSRYGLAFEALREDQLATQSLGLNTTKYKLYNFTIASFLAGVMGAFYAQYLGILSPSPEEFGVYRTVEIQIGRAHV